MSGRLPSPGQVYARVRRSSFAKNFLILFSGTAFAQVIMFAAAPILSRIYSPSDFGVFAVFAAFVGFVTTASTCKYELAVVLPKKDEDAINLVALTIGLVFLTACAASLAVWLVPSLIDLDSSQVPTSLLMAATFLAVLLGGGGPALRFWATRKTMFSRLSVSEIIQAGGSMGTQILCGALGMGPVGLITGRLTGVFLGVLAIATTIVRGDARDLIGAISVREALRLGKAHIVFPKFNLPRAMINAAANNFVVIFLGVFFGAEVAGLYWFAFRIMRLPVTLISRSLQRVFYQKATKLYNDKQSVLALWETTTLILAGISLFPTALVLLFGPEIFAFVFGASWERAGVFSQWLIIGWIATFINAPSLMMIPILSLQREILILEAGKVALQFGAIALAAAFGSEIAAIAAFSGLTLVSNIIMIALVRSRTRRYEDTVRQGPTAGVTA